MDSKNITLVVVKCKNFSLMQKNGKKNIKDDKHISMIMIVDFWATLS